jgi:hypothetical protein
MTICPFAIYQPVSNHSGLLAAHMGLVVHVQVGSGSCYSEFNNPNSQASSTWQAMKDGTLLQFVDADYIAWTEMAGNGNYDSVETEGLPDEPFTDPQASTLAKLMAWGNQEFRWPLTLVDHGESGITTHAHYPSGDPDPTWGGHPCPGTVRSQQLPSIVKYAATLVAAPTPPTPNPPQEVEMFFAPHPSGNGYWIANANGAVFAMGASKYYGGGNNLPGGVKLNSPCTGISASPSGNGYWLVTAKGQVYAFGDAKSFGNAPV